MRFELNSYNKKTEKKWQKKASKRTYRNVALIKNGGKLNQG